MEVFLITPTDNFLTITTFFFFWQRIRDEEIACKVLYPPNKKH